ncbi:MAG TPA: hypothetical protein VHE53_05560 [Patescibacteria group bacterium]|nr:hypothetical protein [Patescibacteria group bacterium]
MKERFGSIEESDTLYVRAAYSTEEETTRSLPGVVKFVELANLNISLYGPRFIVVWGKNPIPSVDRVIVDILSRSGTLVTMGEEALERLEQKHRDFYFESVVPGHISNPARNS